MVEGGGRLHGALLDRRLAHEAIIYIAPRLLGRGRPLIDLPSPLSVSDGFELHKVTHLKLGDDIRIRGMIRYPSTNDDYKGD